MRLRRALLGEVAGPVVGVDEGHGTETGRAWCLGTTALERLLDLMQKQAEHPPGQRLVSAEMRRLLAESDMFHVIDLARAIRLGGHYRYADRKSGPRTHRQLPRQYRCLVAARGPLPGPQLPRRGVTPRDPRQLDERGTSLAVHFQSRQPALESALSFPVYRRIIRWSARCPSVTGKRRLTSSHHRPQN